MSDRLILGMVHHNSREPRFESRFNDPALLRHMGYNGKVYSLFESPVLAVDWHGVEPGTTSGESESWRQELFSPEPPTSDPSPVISAGRTASDKEGEAGTAAMPENGHPVTPNSRNAHCRRADDDRPER